MESNLIEFFIQTNHVHLICKALPSNELFNLILSKFKIVGAISTVSVCEEITFLSLSFLAIIEEHARHNHMDYHD